MQKVVLDTNTLINAAEDENHYARRIVDEVVAGKLVAFANPGTLAENRLLTRQIITDQNFLRLLEEYFNKVQTVRSRTQLNIVEDPEDNKILESAVTSQADCLITSDHHLLALHPYEGIDIITPAEFWNRNQDEAGQGWMGWIKDFIK